MNISEPHCTGIYDAYGVETDKGSDDENPFRYCGEYYDSELDKIYLRARYYAPVQGRFMTEDPIRDGGNWYSYCEGNPVRYVDSSGLKYVFRNKDDAILQCGAMSDMSGYNGYKVVESSADVYEIIDSGLGKCSERGSKTAKAIFNAVYKLQYKNEYC